MRFVRQKQNQIHYPFSFSSKLQPYNGTLEDNKEEIGKSGKSRTTLHRVNTLNIAYQITHLACGKKNVVCDNANMAVEFFVKEIDLENRL